MDSVTVLGNYTVRIGLRRDNPAFPCFIVYRGDLFIGKQFSFPSEADCQWLERNSGRYAQASPFALASCELGKRRASAVSGRTSSSRSDRVKKTLETA